MLLARGHDDIMGMLSLVVYPVVARLRARIGDVVVDQAARGQGVGEALVRAALGVAAAEGARTVDLTSRPSRVAANRLYQRLGFQARDSLLYRLTLKAW
jgi:ribosomal protein S18 acetylase RimI-like enzyme